MILSNGQWGFDLEKLWGYFCANFRAAFSLWESGRGNIFVISPHQLFFNYRHMNLGRILTLLSTEYACARLTRWKLGENSRVSCSLRGGGRQGEQNMTSQRWCRSAWIRCTQNTISCSNRSSEFSDCPLCWLQKKTFLSSSEYLTHRPVTVVRNTKSLEPIKGDNLKLMEAALCST